ncbi:MAG: hypothetical protein V1791_10285 [Pseudomonadota bacterium]
MALVRKTNTKRNVTLLIVLSVVVIGAIAWYFIMNRPVNLNGGTDASGGRRDIGKVKEFNQTDFVNGSLFGRDDYQGLQSHGQPLTNSGNTNRSNPFIPPL